MAYSFARSDPVRQSSGWPGLRSSCIAFPYGNHRLLPRRLSVFRVAIELTILARIFPKGQETTP